MDEQTELEIPGSLTQGRWSYGIRIDRPTTSTKAYAWLIDRWRADVHVGAGQAGIAHGTAETWNDAVREAVRGRDDLMMQNRDTN